MSDSIFLQKQLGGLSLFTFHILRQAKSGER